jgi:hypothetical protein
VAKGLAEVKSMLEKLDANDNFREEMKEMKTSLKWLQKTQWFANGRELFVDSFYHQQNTKES